MRSLRGNIMLILGIVYAIGLYNYSYGMPSLPKPLRPPDSSMIGGHGYGRYLRDDYWNGLTIYLPTVASTPNRRAYTLISVDGRNWILTVKE